MESTTKGENSNNNKKIMACNQKPGRNILFIAIVAAAVIHYTRSTFVHERVFNNGKIRNDESTTSQIIWAYSM